MTPALAEMLPRLPNLPTLATDVASTGPVLGATLSASVIAGAVVVLGAAAGLWQLRRRSAAARHAVWTAAALAHLLLPILMMAVPARGVWPHRAGRAVLGWMASPLAQPTATGTPTAARTAVRSNRGPRSETDVMAPAPAGVSSGNLVTAMRAAPVRPDALPRDQRRHALTLAALWCAGALGILLRPAVGGWQVRRLARGGVVLDDGPWRALAGEVAARLGVAPAVARAVVLRRAAGVVVPMTWGVVRPTVLLPAAADAWPETRRRAVLAHELAHVRRADAATQGLARFALALFWFDPLVWLVVHRMRVERERACDDLALDAGLMPSAYADALLACARAARPGWASGGALPFARCSAARPSEFEARVRAVLDPHHPRTPWSRSETAALGCGVVAICVALASSRPAHAHLPSASPSLAHRGTFRPVATREVRPPAIIGRLIRPLPSSARNAVGAGIAAAPRRSTADSLTSRPATASSLSDPSRERVTPAQALPDRPLPAVASMQSESRTPPSAAAYPDPLGERARESTPPCDVGADTARSKTMWIYADAPGGGRRTEYRRATPGRCAQVAVVGAVRLDPRDADVAALAPDAAVLVREVVRVEPADEGRAGAERVVRITAGSDGRPVHAYTVDGRPAAFDAVARAWLAGVAPALAREAGVDAPARVARWRTAGGVPAALRGIADLESNVAKRAHYLALLDAPDRAPLAPADARAVAAQARRDLARSPDDLRDVLARLAPP